MSMMCVVSCGCDGERVTGCPELISCARGVVLLGAVAKCCCCSEAAIVGAEGESSHRRSKGAHVDEERLDRSELEYRFC